MVKNFKAKILLVLNFFSKPDIFACFGYQSYLVPAITTSPSPSLLDTGYKIYCAQQCPVLPCIYCIQCIYCIDCIYCFYCIYCTQCIYCIDCIQCIYCIDCIYCFYCIYGIQCIQCIYCIYSIFCIRCTYLCIYSTYCIYCAPYCPHLCSSASQKAAGTKQGDKGSNFQLIELENSLFWWEKPLYFYKSNFYNVE